MALATLPFLAALLSACSSDGAATGSADLTGSDWVRVEVEVIGGSAAALPVAEGLERCYTFRAENGAALEWDVQSKMFADSDNSPAWSDLVDLSTSPRWDNSSLAEGLTPNDLEKGLNSNGGNFFRRIDDRGSPIALRAQIRPFEDPFYLTYALPIEGDNRSLVWIASEPGQETRIKLYRFGVPKTGSAVSYAVQGVGFALNCRALTQTIAAGSAVVLPAGQYAVAVTNAAGETASNLITLGE